MFGPESGGRSRETVRGEGGDQRSTITIKRPICYNKQRKCVSVVSLLPPPRTNVFLRFIFRQPVTSFVLLPFFSLYGEYVVRFFSTSGWCFFYLILGGVDVSL